MQQAIAHAEQSHRRGRAVFGCASLSIIPAATPSSPRLAGSPASPANRWKRALGPPVDLLIRTGGERRLSDFLLWECAYAELVFSPRMWPDFSASDLAAAVREFRGRDRRFGTVPPPLAHSQEAWLD